MPKFKSKLIIEQAFLNLGIIFLSVFLSCSERSGKKNDLRLIDIGGNVKTMHKIYLSQFTKNVWYVPLETNSANPISWTYRFLSDYSEEYILDSDGKICLLYDNAGHYLRQIGSQGRGPGEYTGISSVFLKGQKIYIHDFYTDDIIEFMLDGTFQKRYKSGFTADNRHRLTDAIMINDSMILGNIENGTGLEAYKALIIDKQGDIYNYYKNYIFFNLETGVSHAKSPGHAIYYKFGKNLFFKELLNDTLFQLDDQYQLKPLYVFNFGKYKEPVSDRGSSWLQIDLSSYINLDHIYQTENFLILECNYNKYFPAKRLTPEIISLPGLKDYTQWYNTKAVLGIYDKRTENLVFSEPTSTDNHLFTTGFYNDLDAGPRFFPGMMVNDSTMVMKIRFDHMTEHVSSDDFKNNTPKLPENKKRLEFLVDSLTNAGFDNPVLMFVTFNN
jgi:hypothetical protein